jgi:hypothetical protein
MHCFDLILFCAQVKAVIWNISPNVRRDALLTGQARLINLFKKRDIWNNVIIVAKQSLSPESDCQVTGANIYKDTKPYTEPTKLSYHPKKPRKGGGLD